MRPEYLELTVLTGAQPHSCLYAVYYLLEEHLGCGFFEDGDQVPRCRTVKLPEDTDIALKPRFDMRIFNVCMQDAQSGLVWWGWDRMKQWVEWMAKRRFNVLCTERLADCCGVLALAATRAGVPIALTDWQRARLALLKEVFAYARTLGIRTMHNVGFFAPTGLGVPGSYPYPDQIHLEEYVRGYAKQTGDRIRTATVTWCGVQSRILDPRSRGTQKLITGSVQAYQEALGADGLYIISNTPYEGVFGGHEIEEYIHSIYAKTAEAVRVACPTAEIWTRSPSIHHPTFPIQKRAIQELRIPVNGDWWLNDEGRLHDFLQCEYYWGLPWSTGMTVGCGPASSPMGNLENCIRHAQTLAAEPLARGCKGFLVSSEMNHRNMIMMEAFARLAWDPRTVRADALIRHWASARHGKDGGTETLPAFTAIQQTLLSHNDKGCFYNPMFRAPWRGGYLSGNIAGSVKRFVGFLPELRKAMERLLSAYGRLKDNPLYLFDLVDTGRVYLAAVYNERFAKMRIAFRARDREAFESLAGCIVELMHFMARFCGSHEEFRLKTLDEWAGQWPEIVPGTSNSKSNWITFTGRTMPREAWPILLDYNTEDHAELIEHYYLPRVELYIQKMRDLLHDGRDISGRLVYRGTDSDLPNRVSDVVAPAGNLPWSAFGPPCEPELTSGDDALAFSLIEGGSVSGRLGFYAGPMDELVQQMLARYPVPDDLRELLSREEQDKPDTVPSPVMRVKPGEKIAGFLTPAPVEHVQAPDELAYLVAVEKASGEYDVHRGDVYRYRVQVGYSVTLTRLASESEREMEFGFEVLAKRYVLRYDSGARATRSSLTIESRS